MRKSLLAAGAIGVFVAGSAGQGRPAPNAGPPPAIQDLLKCRSIGDTTQRLACFDRQSAVIDQGIAKRDIVVIDKTRAIAAKKSLFGFSIPNFGGLFGGGEDEVKQIESSITALGHNADGGWTLRLADGSTWTQVDDAQLGLPPVRGDKVVIKRGTLGSFWLELAKQPGFKVKRIG
jgi:hypothetical protein